MSGGGGDDDGYSTALDAARRAMATDVSPTLVMPPYASAVAPPPTLVYASSAPSPYPGLDMTQEAALREAARREADETAPGAKQRLAPEYGERATRKEQSGALADVMHSVLQQQQRSIAGCQRVPDPDKPPRPDARVPPHDTNASSLPDVVCDLSPPAAAACSAPPYDDVPLLVSDTHPYGFHDILVQVFQERAHAEYKNEVVELAYEGALLVMAAWLAVAIY